MPYFSYSLDKTEASSGEFIKLQINANRVADPAAGFKITVGYDSSILSFICTETSSKIKSGTLVTNSGNNPIYSVYVCNTDHNEAPELSGNIISFVFKVNDDASLGKTYINARINDICNYDAENLNLDTQESLLLSIVNSEIRFSGNASLKALQPFSGKLVPDFSSDIYKYSMEVKDYVNSVEFAAEAQDGGSVNINRKSLQKAGTTTPVIVTVTSKDKKEKTYYIINVKRLSVPVSVNYEQTKKSEKSTEQKINNIQNIKGSNNISSPQIKQNSVDLDSEYATSKNTNEVLQTNGQPSKQSVPCSNNNTKNIYIIGNRVPVYLVGMMTAVLCILVGIILCFYLKIKNN